MQEQLPWPGSPKINYVLILGEEMETASVDNSLESLVVNKKSEAAGS